MKTFISLTFLVLCGTLLPAQLVGTKGAFRTDHGIVTIERFDPVKKNLHLGVMVLHGGTGPNGDWRKSGILEALVGAGYPVFVPHYFDSTGDAKPEDWPQKFGTYIRTLNDASRYVAHQPDIQSTQIGLVGIALGGFLSIGLAEETFSHPPPMRSPKINAVVEMYGGMPEFAIARMIAMPPVLILHGEDDNLVPVSEARNLEKVLKEKSQPYQIKIYSHQGHSFEGDALQDARQQMVTFLHDHLR